MLTHRVEILSFIEQQNRAIDGVRAPFEFLDLDEKHQWCVHDHHHVCAVFPESSLEEAQGSFGHANLHSGMLKKMGADK